MPELPSFEPQEKSGPVHLPPQTVPHRRNQLLAVVLVGVAATLFVTVLGLVILLHYAETHHMLAAL